MILANRKVRQCLPCTIRSFWFWRLNLGRSFISENASSRRNYDCSLHRILLSLICILRIQVCLLSLIHRSVDVILKRAQLRGLRKWTRVGWGSALRMGLRSGGIEDWCSASWVGGNCCILAIWFRQSPWAESFILSYFKNRAFQLRRSDSPSFRSFFVKCSHAI